jgi:hypothetical protein
MEAPVHEGRGATTFEQVGDVMQDAGQHRQADRYGHPHHHPPPPPEQHADIVRRAFRLRRASMFG